MSGDLFPKFFDDEIAVVMLLESKIVLKIRPCIDTADRLGDGHGLQGKYRGDLWNPVAPAFVLMIVEDRIALKGPSELEPSVKRFQVCFSSSKKVPKRRGVSSDDVVSFIPLSILTLGLLMIEVNVV
jgi:hypothetical protein